MAANVPNPGTYLQALGQTFTQIRDLLRAVGDDNDYIASMGGATFLTTAYPNGLGMSTGDANALIATLGNHKTFASAYTGGPAPPVMNYAANAQPFWGGE